MRGDAQIFETVKEILGYADEELDKAEILRSIVLYRNAAIKPFSSGHRDKRVHTGS